MSSTPQGWWWGAACTICTRAVARWLGCSDGVDTGRGALLLREGGQNCGGATSSKGLR
jgi:hypothetical protein